MSFILLCRNFYCDGLNDTNNLIMAPLLSQIFKYYQMKVFKLKLKVLPKQAVN